VYNKGIKGITHIERIMIMAATKLTPILFAARYMTDDLYGVWEPISLQRMVRALMNNHPDLDMALWLIEDGFKVTISGAEFATASTAGLFSPQGGTK
jgi:hypothetical protein